MTPRSPLDRRWLRGRLAAWDAAAHDLELLDDGEALRLAVAVPSGAAVATVRPTPDGSGWTLQLERDGPPPTEADAGVAEATLRRAWGWDDDLATLDAAAEEDPPFAPGARRLRGARVVRHLSPVEALAWALIRQRTPHGFARASLTRVRDALGPEVHAFGRRWTAFPDAATLASDDARPALLAATNNVRKVERLHAAAGTLAGLDEGWLRTAPLPEARRALARAHGVGTWTVDYLLLLGLGRLAHVPWTDTGLAQAVADVYAGGLRLDPGTMRTLAARYEPLGGVWAHWLKRARHGWRGY